LKETLSCLLHTPSIQSRKGTPILRGLRRVW
jgi:hypothetical protein